MSVSTRIPLSLQLADADSGTRYIRAFVRNYLNLEVAAVDLTEQSRGLYINSDTYVSNVGVTTAQYAIYSDSGYTSLAVGESASFDAFNIEKGIRLGATLPIYYQLFNYASDKFVRAYVTNADGVSVATVNLSVIDLGLYSNTAVTMPATEFVRVQYVVYDDSGYTVVSAVQGAGLDIFSRDILPTGAHGVGGGQVPNMSTTLLNWFQPMTFEVITKETINFQVIETATDVSFRGVWQPFTDQQLQLKPEGQRAWSWIMLHADVNLKLNPDDAVVYETIRYRVMGKRNYKEYQFLEYHLVEDYEGSLDQ